MGLLGRLKLQLRSSQFHKRRRLNGNRFAVAPAFEGLEVRSLLSGTALGGLVFNKVDQVQINNWQVNEGSRVVNGTAHFFGTDASTGHAKAVELSVNSDGTFGSTLDYLDWASVYEQQNPGANSYASTKGFYEDTNGNGGCMYWRVLLLLTRTSLKLTWCGVGSGLTFLLILDFRLS